MIAAPRVLLDDGVVLVVEKTAGVSVSAGEPTDLVARARAHFGGYVASHHALPRDVSGPVLLLRDAARNAAVAATIARGELAMDVVAVVEDRRGRRSIVRETTARIADLRQRLARAGTPVVGDETPWHRVALHVEAIAFPHPVTHERVVVRSPAPPAIERARAKLVTLPGGGDLARTIADAFERRAGLLDADTTVARLAHEAGDDLPGVAIDAYDGFAVLHLSADDAIARMQEIADVLAGLGARGVHAKLHPRQASTLVDPRRDDVAPRRPIAGEAAPESMLVRERGLVFEARLADGLATGVYLDQRENRRLLRERSAGKRVLNLFAYTCPFTVAAAVGGAARTTSVDTARIALAGGERNLAHNGVAPAGHAFVVEDAVTFLKRALARRDRFDLVVLDPPSFATTKSARFSVADDFAAIAADALAVLAPGGTLLASTNHRGLSRRTFAGLLRGAAERAKRSVEKLAEGKPPVDFPAPPGGEPHLKSAWVTVR